MPDAPPPLLTVGYGAREIDAFVELLQRHGVRYLLDVRSSPYSKFKPDFSQDALTYHLGRADIRYAFFGDAMGGRPADSACYRPDGAVDYDACRAAAPFRAGLERLRAAYERGAAVVLMCSEGKPQDCHRSKMIGVALETAGIPLRHIDERGELRTQTEVMAYVNGNQFDIFAGPPTAGLTSRGRYRPTDDAP